MMFKIDAIDSGRCVLIASISFLSLVAMASTEHRVLAALTCQGSPPGGRANGLCIALLGGLRQVSLSRVVVVDALHSPLQLKHAWRHADCANDTTMGKKNIYIYIYITSSTKQCRKWHSETEAIQLERCSRHKPWKTSKLQEYQ